jgi:hypothetical protein
LDVLIGETGDGLRDSRVAVFGDYIFLRQTWSPGEWSALNEYVSTRREEKMDDKILLTLGLACIVAAIIGGGLKAFGIEISPLQSSLRQVLLGALGLILVGVFYISSLPPPSPGREIELCDNKNNGRVSENPQQPTEFKIPEPYYITYIWTYHYNGGKGVTPGNIALRRADGALYGPWEVTAADLRQKIDWETKPNVVIPAGQYTIIDSERAYWSWSDESHGMGMAKVKGYPASNKEPRSGRVPCSPN